jgi:isoleucyl-tRNA synthetase
VDVWFESGASHSAVLPRAELAWPADVYLEGHDQYRGWFHSSLLVAVQGHDGRAPYRQVVTHGFTLDQDGRKMSKSLGNVVSPMELAESRGAEIIRLWVAMVDFLEDMWVSEESLTRHTEAYRKIRNTFRYILGNLHDFDPASDGLETDELVEIDRWILARFDEVRERMLGAYERFEFHVVAHTLHQFCGVELSSFYLDVIKDRLYTDAPASRSRRSGQTALWLLGSGLCRLMAPILSFTAEEVWQQFPATSGREPSVHLATFPGPAASGGPDPERWRALMAMREEVARCLEAARREKRIGSSLEALVTLAPVAPMTAFEGEFGMSWTDFVKGLHPQLPTLLIVSEVEMADTARKEATVITEGPLAGLSVAVARHPGLKCPRCWNYVAELGTDPDHPDVCGRCAPKLAEGLAAGAWVGAVAGSG